MTDTAKTTPLPNSASAQKVGADGQSHASSVGHIEPKGGAAATTPANGAKAAPKPKADAKPKVEGEGTRGRKSQYTGMQLNATTDINKRREGSHGHKSLGIIIAAGKAGIVYEDYIKKGGRLNDLVWDINHDNVEASKPKA